MNRLCVVVDYSEGHKSPYAFLRLMCPTTLHILNSLIEGTEGCIDIESLNSSQICFLSVTDVDALDIIDTAPAIVITDILITRNINSIILQPTSSSVMITCYSPSNTLSPFNTPSVTTIGEYYFYSQIEYQFRIHIICDTSLA